MNALVLDHTKMMVVLSIWDPDRDCEAFSMLKAEQVINLSSVKIYDFAGLTLNVSGLQFM